MNKFLIANSQSFGDILLGLHCVNLLREKYFNCQVDLLIRNNLTLTTAENSGLKDMVKIFKWQNIDNVLIDNADINNYDKIIHQFEWFSDLGIVASMQTDLIIENIIKNFNTETIFHTPYIKNTQNQIVTAGKLDWERKVGFFPEKLFKEIEKYYSLIYLGTDCNSKLYSENIEILNNSILYIGPIGSMAHLSAGLYIDTINVCSLFPPYYDSPEYYHSGYHRSILTNRLQDYSMIEEKNWSPSNSFRGWGNPKTKMGFWDLKYPEFYSDIENELIGEFNKWHMLQ